MLLAALTVDLTRLTWRMNRQLETDNSKNCQGGESNSRPRAYESPALPLSYPGIYFVRKPSGFFFNDQARMLSGAALPLSYPGEKGED